MSVKYSEEAKQVLAELQDRYDYIVEAYKTPDFIEIIGSIGGDIERRRVYPDGRVSAK